MLRSRVLQTNLSQQMILIYLFIMQSEAAVKEDMGSFSQ